MNSLNELSPRTLLHKPYEWIAALFENVKSHIKARREEGELLRQRLDDLEKERGNTGFKYVDLIRDQLIDIAYQLPPEIDELIQERKSEVLKVIEAQKVENSAYLERVWMGEEEALIKFSKELQRVEKHWRNVHHDHEVQTFIELMNSPRFYNPEERVGQLAALKELQVNSFNQRVQVLKTIHEIENLEESAVQKLLDELNEINDDVQQQFDTSIQSIVNLQNKIDQEAQDAYTSLIDKLEYYATGHLNEAISKCRPLVDLRKEEGQTLIKKTISYLEEHDTRSHECSIAIAEFYKVIGTACDKHRMRQTNKHKEYEIELAKRGDDMDAAVDGLEDRFEVKKNELRQAITKEHLELRLEECFQLLDEISAENRQFSDDTIAIIYNHKDMIMHTFQEFKIDASKPFGYIPEFRKEALIEEIKAKQLKEFEDEKAKHEEGKKPPAKKKEEEPVFHIPEFEIITFVGEGWIVNQDLDEIIDRMLTTEEDLAKRKQKEEEERIKEEERLKEEQRKAEEAKRMKAAPGKKQAVQIEEPPQEEEEEEPPYDPIPRDPTGLVVLSTDVMFKFETVKSWIIELRDRIFIEANSELARVLEDAQQIDLGRIEQTRNELDERLRFLWPRKGKLEVTIYRERNTEIQRHHNRFERYLESIKQKHQQQTTDMEWTIQAFEHDAQAYADLTMQKIQALSTGTNLAELQGFQRQVNDAELLFFQRSTERIEHMEGLAEAPYQILKGIEEFLQSLPLFDKGGNYSLEEIEYYRGLLSEFEQELKDASTERNEKVEELAKGLQAQRKGPLQQFEKEYAVALENLAAKEGLGKKYGAPRRSAQEKIRGEMTKVEQGLEGVKSVTQQIREIIGEYQTVLENQDIPFFAARHPPFSEQLRRLLLSSRLCIWRLTNHIGGFNGEKPAMPALTWTEASDQVAPSAEELKLDAERTEDLLEPLGVLGVGKPVPLGQRVMEIEKVSREECAKLYTKGQLPEFMEKYLVSMKESVEKFRINMIRGIREQAEEVLNLTPDIAKACIISSGRGCEFLFEQEMETTEARLSMILDSSQNERQENQKQLRPNLSNPSCSDELSRIESAETARSTQTIETIQSAISHLLGSAKSLSKDYLQKLVNNTDVLLVIFDHLFIREDFIQLPGDDIVEPRRTNIKRLARLKQSGKLGSNPDKRGYKRQWPGLPLTPFQIPGEEERSGEIKELFTYKLPGHKAVVAARDESYKGFSLLFETKLYENHRIFNEHLQEEQRWAEKWVENVGKLKAKY